MSEELHPYDIVVEELNDIIKDHDDYDSLLEGIIELRNKVYLWMEFGKQGYKKW